MSVVGIYELSKRVTLSATWIYGTGNALSVPSSTFKAMDIYFFSQYDPANGLLNRNIEGSWTSQYEGKNNFRAEAFHRLDFSIQFHKKKRRYERTWEVSVYNAYNRKNPFFYDMSQNVTPDGTIQRRLKKYSLFPVLPSVSYNFKF